MPLQDTHTDTHTHTRTEQQSREFHASWCFFLFLCTVGVVCVAMAPKNTGGRGQNSAQDYATGLRKRGLSEQDIRKQLKDDGHKSGRISQLLKATRPTGQEGMEAAAPRDADMEAGSFVSRAVGQHV